MPGTEDHFHLEANEFERLRADEVTGS